MEEVMVMTAPRWHCASCIRTTALRFRWQEFAGGSRHVRMECAGCGRFIRYAPKTPFVLALATEPDDLHERIAELTALVLLLAERLCICSELLGRCAERRGER